jgi:hypothetical protein
VQPDHGSLWSYQGVVNFLEFRYGEVHRDRSSISYVHQAMLLRFST